MYDVAMRSQEFKLLIKHVFLFSSGTCSCILCLVFGLLVGLHLVVGWVLLPSEADVDYALGIPVQREAAALD